MAIIWLFQYLLTTLTVLTCGYYFYFLAKFHAGKKNGIPRVAASFPFGVVGSCYLEDKSFSEYIASIYKKFEGYKYVEIFQTNFDTIVLRDPEVIRNVLIKDSSHFIGRGFHLEDLDDIVINLFTMSGSEKKKMRGKISPTFTTSKLKMMFQPIIDCGLLLQECTKELASKGELVDLRDLGSRFLTDVTANCVFGVESNALRNQNSELRSRGREFFGCFENSYLGNQVLSRYRKVQVPIEACRFFLDLAKETVDYREKNNVKRNDIMDLLLQLKNQGIVDTGNDAKDKIVQKDNEESRKLTVASQAFAFFLAGFDSSNNAVSFCLYELAKNLDIQDKLRAEIIEVTNKHGGEVTYDGIAEMTYLDKVISETLRLHPVGPALTRECTTAYTRDDVTIAKGSQVIIPILALHHDPNYFPEPERFDPERFTPEAKAARTHYTYMPFGDGPMMCIGMRFGVLQSKMALIMILLNSRLSLSYKTVAPKEGKRMLTPQTAMGLFLRMDPV